MACSTVTMHSHETTYDLPSFLCRQAYWKTKQKNEKDESTRAGFFFSCKLKKSKMVFMKTKVILDVAAADAVVQ